jgi:hypothetical protein
VLQITDVALSPQKGRLQSICGAGNMTAFGATDLSGVTQGNVGFPPEGIGVARASQWHKWGRKIRSQREGEWPRRAKAADVPPKIVCSMPSDRRAPVSNIGIADEL